MRAEPDPAANYLGSRLGDRRNALNFIRLALAVLVIIGHSWPLSGDAWSGGPQMAGLAVTGFFALSGYLIAQSRDRLTLRIFLLHRLARIMPAFWICLIVVATVFAPVAGLLTGDNYHIDSAISYIASNAFLWIGQGHIASTLTSVPYPSAWNGSLWTLWFEACAYVMAGLILTAPVRRAARYLIPGMAVALASILLATSSPLDPEAVFVNHGLRLFVAFASGSAVWALRNVLPAKAQCGAPALVLSALALLTLPGAYAHALAPFPLAYGLLWLSVSVKSTAFRSNDYSYGAYVYAFPVQQLLAASGAAASGVATFAALSIVATAPFSWLSWVLVERPTLRWARNRTPRASGRDDEFVAGSAAGQSTSGFKAV